MRIIGVDPGKGGAAAEIVDGKLKRILSFNGGLENCRKIFYWAVPYCFIETVTASPQMGVVSAFTFGRYAEAVETAAQLSGGRVYKARPKKWQNAIGCFYGGDKNKHLEKAKKLYKGHGPKIYKYNCDAVLIAHYGWRYVQTLGGRNGEDKKAGQNHNRRPHFKG